MQFSGVIVQYFYFEENGRVFTHVLYDSFRTLQIFLNSEQYAVCLRNQYLSYLSNR